MAVFEAKAANLLGTGIRYAYAVKSGPWIFLTGHEAFDLGSGIPEAVAGAPGFPLYGQPRWRREGDFILQRMQRILQEFGSDLAHSVRLDQFYPNPVAVDPYHRARRAAFGDYIPPSTSVIMERCFGAESSISGSLLAVVPGSEYEIRKVYPRDVTASASSGFVPTVVCDEFVFVAGQMASSDHGLDPRAHVPDHAVWGGTEIRKQTEFIIAEKLKPALEAAGSSLDRSVKAQVYLKNTEDIPDFIDVWSQYYRQIPCAVTVVPTKGFGMVGGIIEINLMALTHSAKRDKQVILADIPGMAAFGPCLKVGEFLLPSGLMAIDRDGQVTGRTVSPAFSGLSHAGYVQAAAVHDYAEALCKAAGTSMQKLLRAQYFLSDLAHFPGVTMAWQSRFGAHPLPFLCVQIPPDMPAPGMALIADFWIAVD